MFRVNKQKCTSCQACIANCPGATKIGADGKAEVINQEKLEQCGGENVCPIGAIEKTNGEASSYQPSQFEGRGMGAGRGGGLARGPRDGRGGGRGGGGKN